MSKLTTSSAVSVGVGTGAFQQIGEVVGDAGVWNAVFDLGTVRCARRHSGDNLPDFASGEYLATFDEGAPKGATAADELAAFLGRKVRRG